MVVYVESVPGSTSGHLGSSTKKCAAQIGGPREEGGRGGPVGRASSLPPRRHEQRHMQPWHANEIGAHWKMAVDPRPRFAWSSLSFQPKEQSQTNAQRADAAHPQGAGIYLRVETVGVAVEDDVDAATAGGGDHRVLVAEIDANDGHGCLVWGWGVDFR